MSQYVKNEFSQLYKSTIGVDVLSKQIQIKNQLVQLILWDTAGQELRCTKTLFHDADGCILIFNLTEKSSFEQVEFWRKQFLKDLQPLDGEEFPFILIRNMSNMQNVSFVKDENIQDYCLSYNDIPYFYWSAKIGDNVEDTFTKIVELSFNRANQEIIKKSKEKKFIKIDKRGNIIIPKKKIERK